nr:glycosyltransferase family 4 protein [Bacteroidota bacterium]
PVSEEVKIITRVKYSDGKPYFVFIGGMYPRKNLARLLLAFEIFKSGMQSDIKLLIIGQDVWGTDEMYAIHDKMKFKDEVKFTGRINSSEETGKVLASALAMTYVSVFEGFGIPVLEAMHCEIPIITSNVSSMPEVAGDAACYCDPLSPESIADAMRKIATDESYRKSLVEKGKARRQNFSWDKTAELFWQCAERALH